MDILLYIFLGLIITAFLSCIIQLYRVKVWLNVRSRRDSSMVKIGLMNYHGNQRVPEVHLVGRSKSPAIGRIKMGEEDDNAYVEMLISDSNDDSVNPQYRTCGFVTQEGLIYQMSARGNKMKKIGYTARPSSPNKPIAIGERTWKSLWLKCTLNAYRGEPQENAKAKEPIAVCYHTSFHSSKRDAMPPETRAAAYALLYSLSERKDYQEYYDSPAYGWKDTALLAACIYAVVYTLWYVIHTKLLGFPYLGFRIWHALAFYGIFYALWAVVRFIKIECIENSNTIQPKIDLFNKALGQRMFDYAILFCCALTLAYTNSYYRYDFVPLALVIITGIIANLRLPSSCKNWLIKNPFVADEEEEDMLENPSGEKEICYQWKLDSDTSDNIIGELNLYFDPQYVADLRHVNPFYCQRNDKGIRNMIQDMFRFMQDHRGITARVRYVAGQINRMAVENGLSIEDTLQFTLDFVQEPNIRFCMNRESKSINQFEDYIRYPDEVFYDKEADSNSKALLAAMLFYFSGYNVLYLFSKVQHHGAIGIEVKSEWEEDGRIFGHRMRDITFLHNNKRYIFCETTSDGFRIGGTMEGMRYEDFNERVELLLYMDKWDEGDDDTVTCLYNWDLDSVLGNQLHGSYTLEFSIKEMNELREKNPFKTYTQTGNRDSYDGNIRKMFDYLSSNVDHFRYVREIAQYIYRSIKQAQLSELDMVQFALDFCQAPNIQYKLDEESEGIGFAKEYMRFPDEVLLDKEGDCDCKSSLTAALFHELGYNVLVMISMKLQHAAIAIECKDEWLRVICPEDPDRVVRIYNNKKYLFCETTGDGFHIGEVGSDSSIQDFETIVEINV